MTEAAPNLVGILVFSAALGLLLLAVLTVTSFVKFAVILLLVRNALGAQGVPPNLVVYAIALILTVFVSMPLIREVSIAVTAPGTEYDTFADWIALARRAEVPLSAHLTRATTPEDRAFFLAATNQLWPEELRREASAEDLAILVPAFLTTELRKAFEIGFLLYLPFVVIDLVVTTIMMAMGMNQVQPQTIAIPLKLFLFVVAEGWTRLLHGLVLG